MVTCSYSGKKQYCWKAHVCTLAQKFEKGNATVTVCHTGAPDISKFTKDADIIIAAVGIYI